MLRYRHILNRRNLMMLGMPSATAAFCFWAQGNPDSIIWNTLHRLPFQTNRWPTNASRGLALSSASFSMDEDNKNGGVRDDSVRSFQTQADIFYKENMKIPLPAILHATLTELSEAQEEESTRGTKDEIQKNILVIGDVHGCYDELLELHTKAVKENDSVQFRYVILVGDLCNKGPESAKVIRHTRLTPGWFSVRGNHDDAALAAALGDKKRLSKDTYQWVKGNDSSTNTKDSVRLSDNDINWLSQLPYTIQIPGNLLGEDVDTLIVHAGLIPYCEIQDQKIPTMTTIRDLRSRCNEDGKFTHFEYHSSKGGEDPKVLSSDEPSDIGCNEVVTWASAWKGPQRVIFGHDARRKLQLHERNWTTGLDTGAVYGGELTGIILPERKLVSVKSKEYSPIKVKTKKA